MPERENERVSHVLWNGTLREQLDLLAAIQHNCDCVYERMGARVSTCSAHAMLVHDQRALDGLLWHRRLLERLLAEEGLSGA